MATSKKATTPNPEQVPARKPAKKPARLAASAPEFVKDVPKKPRQDGKKRAAPAGDQGGLPAAAPAVAPAFPPDSLGAVPLFPADGSAAAASGTRAAARKGKRSASSAAPAAGAAPAPVPAAVPVAGQRVGYIRVSTLDQNTARQLDEVPGLARVFTDKASGKDTARPGLAAMLAHVREGDTVTVHSLDRLGRNMGDLRQLVGDLTGRGVVVEFLKEGLRFEPGGASSMSMLLLGILGSFAEFERNLMLERQREGIRKAQQAGKYKGRAAALSPDLAAQFRARVLAGGKVPDLAAEFGVSRATAYRLAAEAREGQQDA